MRIFRQVDTGHGVKLQVRFLEEGEGCPDGWSYHKPGEEPVVKAPKKRRKLQERGLL